MTPLTFEPFSRPQPWGARNLEKLLGKVLPEPGQTYGESWEISAQQLHISKVAQGEYAGRTLEQLWNDQREQIAGAHYQQESIFPWLVKYLDVGPMLSMQVHPNDQQAQQLLAGTRGKTEVVVILEASPDAKIYAGFKEPLSREKFTYLLNQNQLLDCVHVISPKVGDCIYIPAGTIHASGGGVTFAEVQQTSDSTFRIYDWGRTDKQGNPRQLHIEQALEVLNWSQGPILPQIPKIIESSDSYHLELLVETPYFKLRRLTGNFLLNNANCEDMQVIMLLQGTADLSYSYQGKHLTQHHQRGQTILIPNHCDKFEYQLKDAQALIIC